MNRGIFEETAVGNSAESWRSCVKRITRGGSLWFQRRGSGRGSRLRIEPLEPRVVLSGSPWGDGPEGEPDATFDLERGQIWHYWDRGSKPPTQGVANLQWYEPAYVHDQDNAPANMFVWDSGPAELGYGDDPVTAVSWGPNDQLKYVTTYFRHQFTIPAGDADLFTRLTIGLQRDDGAAVYLNGTEIIRDEIEGTIGNPIPYELHASGTASNADEETFFTTFEHSAADMGLSLLHDGVNTLAVEVHQTNNTSTDVSFDLELHADSNDTSVVVWAAADSPHLVSSSVTVPDGVTLIIEPGSTVRFAPGTQLTVNGRLLAEGTPEHRILMTRDPVGGGRWGGIELSGSLNDSRLSHVDMEYADSRSNTIHVSSSQLLVDDVSWSNVGKTIFEVWHPSLIVRNSTLPDVAGEVIHGQYIEGDEYLIIEGNVFEVNTSGDDVVDFLGADRPGPVMQVLDNVFLGGGDDGIDLDGTDTHIEGNVFMNFQKDTGRTTTSNAVATGSPQSGADNRTEITVVRNLFFNNDHDILLKEDAFATVENNVFVDSQLASIQFTEVGGSSVNGPGLGAALDGNIFWNAASLFKNFQDDVGGFTTVLSVDRSIIPEGHETVEWDIDDDGQPDSIHSLGQGNIVVDPATTPMFVDSAGRDFHLLPGSPAIGTGPDGLDMGAMVLPGPTITGVPADVSADRDQTFQVAGPGITHYRYSLDGGPFGPATSVDTPVVLTALGNGEHTIEVLGQNSAGDWFAGATPAYRQNTAQIVAPSKVRAGQTLPMVVRVRDALGNVNTTLTTPVFLDNAADLDAATVKIKKGVGSLSPTVTAAGDFTLQLVDSDVGTNALAIDVLDASFPESTHSGTLSGNTVWDAASEHRVTGDLLIPQGSTLTVEAGARVMLGDKVNIRVEGEIVTTGTAAEPVTFNALDPAQPWGGIELVGDGLVPASGRFAFSFFTSGGGGDDSKWFGHSDSQPLIMVDASTLEFVDSFVIDNTGKGFGARNDSTLDITRSVISNVDTGAQFNDSVVHVADSYLKDIPNDDGIFADDDNDGFYFHGVHSSGAPSRFENSFVITTKDDGLDHNDARLEVVGSWIEGAAHEGLATSGGNWAVVENSVFLNNDQGVEAGYGSPDVTVRNSVMMGNNVGLRYGDGDDLSYNGHITAENNVIYDNGDNIRNLINLPGGTSEPVPGAIDITYSMTNDTDYDGDLGNVTGIPVFGVLERLRRGSDGLGAAEDGTALGLLFQSATASFTIDNSQPRLRISEVLADNRSAVDVGGAFPVLIELANDGGVLADLSGMSITNGVDTFVFPLDTSIDQNAYLTLFADGETGLPGEIHLGFSLNADGDDVQLFDAAANGGALVDSVSFGAQLPDLSIGRIGGSWRLSTPSFGSDNVAVAVGDPDSLVINELLAEGNGAFPDDFVEIYNPEPLPVDFGGLYLTNDPATAGMFQTVPLSFVPAGELLVFIADANATAGPDHLNFELDAAGGTIVLGAADLAPIDRVTFGPQVAGISEGRTPNGGEFFVAFEPPTPGRDNPDVVDVISFQDGVSPTTEYAGTRDTWISENNPDANYGDDVEFDADGEASGSQEWALVKWDVNAVPADGRVLDATVTFTVNNASSNTYDLYAVLRDWVEDEATWNEYSAGSTWGSPGATASTDHGVLAGTLDANTTGTYDVVLNADGVTLVQSWVDSRGATNHGLFLYDPASTDGLEIDSREAGTPADPPSLAVRPKLTVLYEVPTTRILDRHVLYAGSAFGAAVATDKRALRPGDPAEPANITSFDAGINAVAIDVVRLPDAAAVDENAFLFRVGIDDDSDNWNSAPAPTAVVVQPQDGFDRIVVRWPDEAITNAWLRVDVLPDGAVGTADTFYFGNAVGDGNGDAMVSAADVIGVRDNPRGPANPASIADPWDYNRDGLVNAADLVLARNNATSPLSALPPFDAPIVGPAPPEGEAAPAPLARNAILDDRRALTAGYAPVGTPADNMAPAAVDVVLTEPTRDGWMQPRAERRRLSGAAVVDAPDLGLLPVDSLTTLPPTDSIY